MTEHMMGPLIPGSMPRQTPAQEWESELRRVIDLARQLVQAAGGLSLIAQSNDIEQLIMGTPDGEPLADTTIRKEDALLRAQLFGDLSVFLAEPVGNQPGAPTRQTTLFRRF